MKMEAIKISVEVSVNLSESTQQFITSIFSKLIPAPQPAPVKPVAPAPQPAPAKPVAPAPVKPVAPASQPAPVSTSVTIEDVRKVLAQKVNEHRDVIKQKLNEFGAPSVTKLDSAKYDEMFNFLNSL